MRRVPRSKLEAKAVAEGGLLDLDVVGEIEDAPERARGDALVGYSPAAVSGFLPSMVNAFCSATTVMSLAPKPATASVIR